MITVYASAAFVIIELIGNLTEPLNLPANLSTIVIIVLAGGFPACHYSIMDIRFNIGYF